MKMLLSFALVFMCAAAGLRAESPIFPALKNELVALDGKRLKRFDDSSLASTKYFAVYYSASWCGPCRKFTPDLVSWYNSHKKDNPHFELIFVSSDNSEDEMAGYMRMDAMPWPALDFKKKSSNRTLTQYAGSGIPCLVLVDAQGHILSDSYQGKNYVGPRKVLTDIEQILKDNPPAPGTESAGDKSSVGKGGSSSFDEFFHKKPVGQ